VTDSHDTDFTVHRAYNDGSEWTATGSDGSLLLHRSFSDGSQWRLEDTITDASVSAKILMAFVVMIPVR
jgi:hypothetical protein